MYINQYAIVSASLRVSIGSGRITGKKGGKESFMDKKILGAGIAMMVLKLLEEEPMYGYQILKIWRREKRNGNLMRRQLTR